MRTHDEIIRDELEDMREKVRGLRADLAAAQQVAELAERERDALRREMFDVGEALGMPFDDEDTRTLVERAAARMNEMRGYEAALTAAEQRAERAEATVKRVREVKRCSVVGSRSGITWGVTQDGAWVRHADILAALTADAGGHDV